MVFPKKSGHLLNKSRLKTFRLFVEWLAARGLDLEESALQPTQGIQRANSNVETATTCTTYAYDTVDPHDVLGSIAKAASLCISVY